MICFSPNDLDMLFGSVSVISFLFVGFDLITFMTLEKVTF